MPGSDPPHDEKLAELSSPAVKPASGAADPYIGSVLGERYEVIEFLGAGAWGNVYRAKHPTLKVDVAIKIAHKHFMQDPGRLKRLQQEAFLLGRLESPYIVRILDYGTLPAPYIVMEYFDGEPLDRWLKSRGLLPPALAIELFMQICRGLSNAHALGFVHRDLKPANLMVKIEDGQLHAKILDFGIAKLVGAQERLTATGEILGSPAYMPPEQWTGMSDHRSDIYSLGCVMYEVLTLKPPFPSEDVHDYAMKHHTITPQPMKSVAPQADFPADLEDLVGKCLLKSPDDRYQSAQEVLDELERVKSGRQLQINRSKARRARQKIIVITCSIVLAGLSVLLFLQKDAIPAFWVEHFNLLGDSQRSHANYASAASNYRMSLQATSFVPFQDRGQLHAMRMLCICLRKLQQFDEAERLQKQINEVTGGGCHPNLTDALRRLNYRLAAGSDLKGCQELSERALQIASALSVTHSLAYADALSASAGVLRARGSYKQALEADQESLGIVEDLAEQDSILVAEKLNNLGDTLSKAGDLKQAGSVYQRALEICSKNINSADVAADSGQTVPKLVLADFNNSEKSDNLGGDLATWDKDVSGKSKGVRLSFVKDDAAGLPDGRSLQLDYNLTLPNNPDCGFWMKLPSEDFSSYDTLNFYARGDALAGFPRRLKIELKDTTSKPSPGFADGINERWQKFSIPFDRFKMISDWSHINEFVVDFETATCLPKTGRICLDQVYVSSEGQNEGKTGALTQMVRSCTALATIARQKKDRQGALSYLEKAQEICQHHRELDPLPVLIGLASFYQEQQDRPRALQYWRIALASSQDDGRGKTSELADLEQRLEQPGAREAAN